MHSCYLREPEKLCSENHNKTKCQYVLITSIGFGSSESTTPACSVILCQNRGKKYRKYFNVKTRSHPPHVQSSVLPISDLGYSKTCRSRK
jgi:hypothetical protein